MNAFDQRYVNRTLNATGFGTNYVNIRDDSETLVHHKAY